MRSPRIQPIVENVAPEQLVELVRFDHSGLVTCVVQDRISGEVLMVAHMNREALELSHTTGELHLYSRSRERLWRKGETSGNVQLVRGLRVDCDGDAVLALVDPQGPACHTGERSCFYRGSLVPPAPFEVVPHLWRTIEERARSLPPSSYTAKLLGDPGLAQAKVIEEADEVARAARAESDQRLAEEAADLLYHLLVLLRSRGQSPEAVYGVLDGRSR